MGRSKALPSFSLSSFVSPSQDGDWYKKVGYQDAKNIIREKMKSSVENFIAIGYYLKHIDETGQYKEDGYANIWECAKQEFGFSQPKASRCINICKAYSVNGDSPYIDERFKNFNTSQLQEMLPFKDDERLIGQITPDMSSRKIRKEVQKAKKEDAGDMKESSPLQGQMQITAIEGEYREFAPASDISDDKDNSPGAGTAQNQPVCAPPEKQSVCYTSNENDVDDAIYFIFCMNGFPEDRLQEIINCYVGAENSTAASIAAELIFNKMLPYDNGQVRVVCKKGYQTEYIQTGEIYNIPACCFWKGFEKKFDERITESDVGADTGVRSDHKRVTIHLPAEVGDTVYFIEGDNDISKGTIDQITLGEGMRQQFRVHDTDGGGVWFYFEASDFGRMLFYSHEDAEAVKGFKDK